MRSECVSTRETIIIINSYVEKKLKYFTFAVNLAELGLLFGSDSELGGKDGVLLGDVLVAGHELGDVSVALVLLHGVRGHRSLR